MMNGKQILNLDTTICINTPIKTYSMMAAQAIFLVVAFGHRYRGFMINNNQVTLIFQGAINGSLLGSGREDGSDFLYNLQRTRAHFANAKVILSTWDHLPLPSQYDTAQKLGIDQLILSSDPGGLPNIKFGYDTPNNVNRQIVSTLAGLQATATEYALKLRADSFLSSAAVLHHYADYLHQVTQRASAPVLENSPMAYSPIVVPNFFTIDPNVYEHMAFHVSDWAQFARTHTLLQYWSVDAMSQDDATYFERISHDCRASYADHNFRTRLAVEQHIATRYAATFGYDTPSQFNQITPAILQAHNDFLARHIVVLDMADFGFALPKYAWTAQDEFMAMNCLNHDDWYQLFYDHWQPTKVDSARLHRATIRAAQKRQIAKSFRRAPISAQAHTMRQLYP